MGSITFGYWKYSADVRKDHADVFLKLSDGLLIDGLEKLPLESIVKHIAEEFPNWKKERNTATISGHFSICWVSDPSMIELFATTQFVRLDFYNVEVDEMADISFMLTEEFGCAEFDAMSGQFINNDVSDEDLLKAFRKVRPLPG